MSTLRLVPGIVLMLPDGILIFEDEPAVGARDVLPCVGFGATVVHRGQVLPSALAPETKELKESKFKLTRSYSYE